VSRWTPDIDALRGGLRGLAGSRSAPVLWVGPQGVFELQANRPTTASPSSAADPPAAPTTAMAPVDFADWCATHPGQACRVLLSSEWLALITSDPALGLRTREDLQAHARTQFEQYHGSAARDWPLRVWQTGAGSGATAVQGGVLARLQAAAAAHGVRLLSVQAAWTVAAAQHTLAKPALLLLLAEGSLVTAIASVQGQTQRVALRRCPQDPAQKAAWEADLRAEWGLGDDCPSRWMEAPNGATSTADWAPLRSTADNDFQVTAPARRLPVLAAVAAACMAIAAALDTHAAWQAAQAAQDALDEAMLASPARTSADSRTAANGEVEAAVLATLRQPWPAVFKASEAATRAQLHWLLFDHDGRALRLEATAPDLPTAWQSAAALGLQPGVTQVVVAHLQADGAAVRFELRADWAAASAPAGRRGPSR
jgi:hypothetical protein